jgi:hypothetical protein
MRRRIHTGGDNAEKRVARCRQIVVIDDVARADELDARFVEPALGELPRERAGLSGRHENEQRIGLQIVRPLQERREVRIGERHFQRVEDLAAALGEIRLEDFAGLGVVTATAKPDRASCDLRSAQVSSQWVNLT